MERIALTPRPDWREKMESIGFDFHTLDDVYWDESACYRFSAAEVDLLEGVTQELHEMCIKAVDHVIRNDLLQRLKIPESIAPLVRRSWERREASLYGRFDFRYDGTNPPKLLEYNADTPTALFEASVAQWTWLEELFPQADQFNSIHERLIERWKELAGGFPVSARVNFACVKDNVEDLTTVNYLRDTAMQAGLDTRTLFVEDIGWDAERGRFVDLDHRPIQVIFKLYPWEWLANEEFGAYLAQEPWRALEPAWKLVLSNKAILPVLWELYPDHPNLFPAYDTPVRLLGRPYVKKPIYSREGASITLRDRAGTRTTAGDYGEEGYIYQEYQELPNFGGNFPVVGSWIIGAAAAGMGLREDTDPITRNTSRFIPHYFE